MLWGAIANLIHALPAFILLQTAIDRHLYRMATEPYRGLVVLWVTESGDNLLYV